jgi:glycine/D-amino acid oxidase-like deaminating enzyme
MKGSKVCVVGGGAVGLSVALYLAKESERKEEKIEITIIAESFLENTTSYGSGGLWEPYKVDGTPDELVNAWGKVTFDFMLGLLADPEKKVASGVQMLTGNN